MVISVASVKGGTGKTTLTYALSWLLSEEGKKILAVDFDPQGNLTFSFCSPESLPPDAATSRLFQTRPVSPFPISQNLHLLFSDGQLYSYEVRGTVSELKSPSFSLRPLKANYDLIFIDTPTSLRPLTKAALIASDAVIAVADPSPFAVIGLIQLAQGLSSLKEKFGSSPTLLGVVVNMVERTKVSEEVLETVSNLIGRERVLGVIPKTVKARQAILYRKPIHKFASGTPLQEAIFNLAERIKEVL